jgi:hypothetical protein
MTNGERLINKLIAKRSQINELQQELEDLSFDLCGMEIEYEGNYAVIDDVDDGQVSLYVEDDEENSYNQIISLYELLEII